MASFIFPSDLNFLALSLNLNASLFTPLKLTQLFCPLVSDVIALLASVEYIAECILHAFSSPIGPKLLPILAWPKKSWTNLNTSLTNNGVPLTSLNPLSINNGFSFLCSSVIGVSPNPDSVENIFILLFFLRSSIIEDELAYGSSSFISTTYPPSIISLYWSNVSLAIALYALATSGSVGSFFILSYSSAIAFEYSSFNFLIGSTDWISIPFFSA